MSSFKYVAAILLLPFQLSAQGGLLFGNGSKVVISGSPQIVIENGRFVNDGDFTSGNSTVLMTGNAITGYTTIGGTSVTAFHDLTISKGSNDVRLDYDIEVTGDLKMNGGHLILNYSDIVLGGDILGETETTCITGTEGGAIIKTVTLNNPSAENPGNLGLEITSPASLGTTTIRRSHVLQVNGNNHSIHRSFDVSSDNNANLDAIIRIYYFDGELAALNENNLDIWQKDNGNWILLGSENNDTNENWIETSGVAFLETITLAEDLSIVLPIELLSFAASVNENKEVDLYWQTATEINNDYFTVERSKDGINFERVVEVPGAGNTLQPKSYQYLDNHPFTGRSYYRLKQTDFDGAYTFSEIRAVNIDTKQRFTVYPNPLNDVLHIAVNGSEEPLTHIELFDAAGVLKYAKQPEANAPYTAFDIYEVAEMPPGNYFLVLQTANESHTFKLVKANSKK